MAVRLAAGDGAGVGVAVGTGVEAGVGVMVGEGVGVVVGDVVGVGVGVGVELAVGVGVTVTDGAAEEPGQVIAPMLTGDVATPMALATFAGNASPAPMPGTPDRS